MKHCSQLQQKFTESTLQKELHRKNFTERTSPKEPNQKNFHTESRTLNKHFFDLFDWFQKRRMQSAGVCKLTHSVWSRRCVKAPHTQTNVRAPINEHTRLYPAVYRPKLATGAMYQKSIVITKIHVMPTKDRSLILSALTILTAISLVLYQ